MAETTGIAWTDSTFNPWMGCTKVGPGCDNCYAEVSPAAKFHGVVWGNEGARHRTAPSTWHHPIAWNSKPFYECLSCRHRFSPPAKMKDGYVTCPKCSAARGKAAQDRDEASAVKQVRRRVFCASLADVFDNKVAPAWRADLFKLIRATPNLAWLLLTKRIGNAHEMIGVSLIHAAGGSTELLPTWPWPNVWLGASVVNQEEANRDIPKLLATPAVKRFVSYEPALGPIDFEPYLGTAEVAGGIEDSFRTWEGTGLDWIIVGGESKQPGRPARQFNLEWARVVRQQCYAAGVAFFMKQIGAYPTRAGDPEDRASTGADARAGTDMSRWPEELCLQEFPE